MDRACHRLMRLSQSRSLKMSTANNIHSSVSDTVKRRMVFYFSGYDPRGASYYHKLYSAESAHQASINGLDLDVGKRRRVHPLAHAWKVLCQQSGTETDYEFLRWDDIIRKHWPRNEWQLFRVIVPSYWEFLKANWFWRVYKVSWTSALTAAYPVIVFCGLLFLSALLAVLAIVVSVQSGAPWWVGGMMGLALFYGGVKLGRLLDEHMYSYWQLRTHCAMQKWSYGGMPELDERMDDFAAYMVEKIRSSEADEVLLVGHSAGTILGVALVAKMLQLEPDLGRIGPDFAFASLANCLPLVTFLPGANGLRDDLHRIASDRFAEWFDFSARRDGACVSVGDLVTMAGVTREEGDPMKPRRVPVSIVKMFPPETYARIKKDLFRVHFQYIMASDLLTDYDYFAITAGPVKLAKRYASWV